jgi:hypothetical protein
MQCLAFNWVIGEAYYISNIHFLFRWQTSFELLLRELFACMFHLSLAFVELFALYPPSGREAERATGDRGPMVGVRMEVERSMV